ncbi:MAG TPA: ROK family transcriptional regulator [Feifaniaceae bacterium]|nr:ROK family transcriptional regulator [Feifaniaceae bacterium]
MEKINSQTMKMNNARIVLDAVRKRAPVSRAALAKELGLTSPAVTNIVASLIKSNVLLETGVANASKGRRPIMLDTNPEAYYLAGVVLTTDGISFVLCDFKARPVLNHEIEVDRYAKKEAILDNIVEGVEYLLQKSGVKKERVLGMGIAAPGPLDSRNGILINPPNFPDMKNVAICSILEERLGIPCCCDRETNAAALVEASFGTAAPYKTMFYLMMFKQSIGGSLVTNGNVIHGFMDGAGEIGHMLIEPNGPRCTCGQYGCLEAMVKGEALINEARTRIKLMDNCNLPVPCDVEELRLEDIFRLSDLGIPLFVDIIDKAARAIAVALGNVVTLFSPELIVLGGTLPSLSEGFVERIRTYTRGRKYPQHAKDVVIEASSLLGTLGCAIGAAVLALETFEERLCADPQE